VLCDRSVYNNQSYIMYFESVKGYQSGRPGKGTVELDGASVFEGQHTPERKEFRFIIQASKPVSRQYEFVAGTSAQLGAWLGSLRTVLDKHRERDRGSQAAIMQAPAMQQDRATVNTQSNATIMQAPAMQQDCAMVNTQPNATIVQAPAPARFKGVRFCLDPT
jgi:hypothetical protein